MKRYQLIALAAVCTAAIGGCSSSGDSSGSGTPAPNPLGDATIVTDNPTGTVPWSQVVGKTNIAAKIREAESGFSVYERPVTVVSAAVAGGKDILTILAPQGDNYGAGDSGSPILINGKVAGAVFSGDDPQHFYAISISQEQTTGAQAGSAPTAAPTKSGPTGFAPQWYFSGPASMMQYVTKNPTFSGTRLVSGAASAKAAVTPDNQPLPGRRFAAAILYGPQAELYAQATYTYQLSSGKWLGTGHSIGGNGVAQWPIFPAYADYIENNGDVETHIVGNAYGTLLFDGIFGSLIDATKTPATMPITVQITVDGKSLATQTHHGIMDRGSQMEQEAIDVGATTPVSIGLYSLPDVLSGAGAVQITAGGATNSTPIFFSATPESPSAFISDVELNVDQDVLTQYANDPTHQITAVTVTLQVLTTPVTTSARTKP